MVDAVRRVLPGVKASNTPPYRLLLEAVGLPVPASAASPYSARGQGGAGGWQGQGQGQGQGGGRRYGGAGGYGGSPYGRNGGSPGPGMYQGMNGHGGGGGLAPLAVPHASPGMNGGNSPRTPVPSYRGRLSPASQMMSPGSDPFNPVSSPLPRFPLSRVIGGGME